MRLGPIIIDELKVCLKLQYKVSIEIYEQEVAVLSQAAVPYPLRGA